MKRYYISIILLILTMPVFTAAQEESKDYKLISDRIDKQSGDLDQQILILNKNISSLIKKYDLLKTPGIRILPFQSEYNLGPDFIEFEKHIFIKDNMYPSKITGIKKKKLKIFTNGQAISKTESTLYEKDFGSGSITEVFMVDPSPESQDTNDISFTHTQNGKVLMENRKFGDMKNTTAHAVRNEIKQHFLIPHLSIFYDALLFTASSYYKSIKDSDSNMSEFLMKSTNY